MIYGYIESFRGDKQLRIDLTDTLDLPCDDADVLLGLNMLVPEDKHVLPSPLRPGVAMVEHARQIFKGEVHVLQWST